MTPSIRKILLPTDFGPSSERAAAYAGALARGLGASVYLVHVLEEPPITADPWPLHHSPLRARQHSECHAKLAALAAAKLQDATDRITLEVRAGTPADSIVEAAIAYGVDVIVMSAPRLNGLPGLLMASVAGRVLRTAPCPVLLVGDSGAARVHVRKRAA